MDRQKWGIALGLPWHFYASVGALFLALYFLDIILAIEAPPAFIQCCLNEKHLPLEFNQIADNAPREFIRAGRKWYLLRYICCFILYLAGFSYILSYFVLFLADPVRFQSISAVTLVMGMIIAVTMFIIGAFVMLRNAASTSSFIAFYPPFLLIKNLVRIYFISWDELDAITFYHKINPKDEYPYQITFLKASTTDKRFYLNGLGDQGAANVHNIAQFTKHFDIEVLHRRSPSSIRVGNHMRMRVSIRRWR